MMGSGPWQTQGWPGTPLWFPGPCMKSSFHPVFPGAPFGKERHGDNSGVHGHVFSFPSLSLFGAGVQKEAAGRDGASPTPWSGSSSAEGHCFPN